MTSTLRFGRIAGIEVGAHWTWLLVVALVVWSLAAGVFPAENPGLAPGVYVAMAVVAAALFFASLLAHELGHAVQARRDGVAVEGITLWVFGGVARLAASPPSAAAELRIALAGPLVSLVAGVAFVGLSAALGLPGAVDGVVYWVGSINLLLLAFNLLPAFPLDGGRVLRALLWWRGGDLARATAAAAAVGRAFAAGFIALGFVLAVFAGTLGGLWMALIGFFLPSAAEAELELARVGAALGHLRVTDVMVRHPVTAPADVPLSRFVEDVFLPTRHTAYPVVAGGDVVGLVSFRDVLAVPREDWDRLRLADRMRPLDRVRAVAADRPLAEVVPGRPRGLPPGRGRPSHARRMREDAGRRRG